MTMVNVFDKIIKKLFKKEVKLEKPFARIVWKSSAITFRVAGDDMKEIIVEYPKGKEILPYAQAIVEWLEKRGIPVIDLTKIPPGQEKRRVIEI